jgi:hypothetical protein
MNPPTMRKLTAPESNHSAYQWNGGGRLRRKQSVRDSWSKAANSEQNKCNCAQKSAERMPRNEIPSSLRALLFFLF